MNIPRALIWPTATFNTRTPAGMAAAEAQVREWYGEDDRDVERLSLLIHLYGDGQMRRNMTTHERELVEMKVNAWRERADPLPAPKPGAQCRIYGGALPSDPTTTEDT